MVHPQPSSSPDLEGGYSESQWDTVNDDRDIIYVRGYDTLTVALNSGRARGGEEACADTYTKAKD